MLEERNKKYRNIDLVVKNNALDIHDIIEAINNLPSLTPIEERVETLEDDVDTLRTNVSSLDSSVGNLSAKIDNECVSQEEFQGLEEEVESQGDLVNQHGESIIRLSDIIDLAITDVTTNYATKDFVNSSIQTNTATFRGTYDLVEDLQLPTTATNAQIATKLNQVVTTKTNNDYCFVYIDLTQTSEYKRFKYNGSTFEYEYTLNNSSFTNSQWAAINSGLSNAERLSMKQDITQNATDIGTLDDRLTTQEARTIPTQLSQLTGDTTHRTVTDTEISTWNNKSNFSGNYTDLTNKPTIPTLLSQLTGDTTHRVVTDTQMNAWNNKSNFSGSYTDLSNKPTIPINLWDLNDNSTHRLVTDTEKATWNAKSNFSGSYNDLTDKPAIPGVTHIYQHNIYITDDAYGDKNYITLTIINTTSSAYTTQTQLVSVIGDIKYDCNGIRARTQVSGSPQYPLVYISKNNATTLKVSWMNGTTYTATALNSNASITDTVIQII